MSGIKGKNTKPEIRVRKALYSRGFRYRLHVKGLPGKPDIVFGKRKAVIFIHGCFWHGHDCHLFKWPSTRQEFWRQKINRNREKDAESEALLSEAGWRILTIWECALKGKTRLDFEPLIDDISEWIVSGDTDREIEGRLC
jgi:DNA mismatch endonuclease Vsr